MGNEEKITMKYEGIKDSYIKLIFDALQKVGDSYFEIKMTGMENEKRRERVFCYELYHQMRLFQDRDNTLSLSINAEIDKSGHKVICENFNPDFVIHRQGVMANYCVIEVKTNPDVGKILKDFTTIKCMMHYYDYRYGVFILTGSGLDWFKEKIIPNLTHPYLIQNSSKVYILCKENKNSEIEVSTLKDLIGR
jgi:hypothetical protein